MDQMIKPDLIGRKITVALECADEFNKLFAHTGLNASGVFTIRSVKTYGNYSYFGFVKENRDPEREFFAPFDGVTDASFFHLTP